MRMLLIAVLFVFPGCATTDAIQGQIAERGAAISDEARETASWTLCKAISIGSWVRAYGNDPKKAEAWKVLCSESVTQTP